MLKSEGHPAVPSPVVPSSASVTSPLLPSSASVHSNSTSSLSRRRNWADITDNSSDEQDACWTPSSNSAAPAPFGSLAEPEQASLLEDLSDDYPEASGNLPQSTSFNSKPLPVQAAWAASAEPDDADGQSSTSHDSRRGSMEAQSSASRDIRRGMPTRKGRRNAKKSSSAGPQDFPTPGDSVSDSSAPRSLLSAQRLTPADDARFWADQASSTQASSGSERGGPRPAQPPARPAAWSVGAEHHASGTCHPCIFHPKAAGCENGADCPFCHLDHEPRARHRRHMRRGRGQNEGEGSESKEDGQDPEQVTFILPSALRRAEKTWGRDAEEVRSAPRLGGLRISRRSKNSVESSSSSAQAAGDSTTGGEAEHGQPQAEPPSLFTTILAPLFGGNDVSGGNSGPASSMDPDLQHHGSSRSAETKTSRPTNKSKVRSPLGPP